MADEEAPCCRKWRKARAQAQAWAATTNVLVGGIPRYIHQMFDIACRHDPNFAAVMRLGTRDRCPCQESPYPEAMRELFRRMVSSGMKYNPDGPRALDFDKMCDLANDIARERGLIDE